MGGRLIVRARRVDRIQLPARLVKRTWVGPGDSMVVEFPGPDSQPMQGGVFAFYRRGLGATNTFAGWVWVNRSDPHDIMTRPGGRTALGGTILIVGAVFAFGALGTGFAATIAAATGSMSPTSHESSISPRTSTTELTATT